MSESDNSRIGALLVWVYNFFVHRVLDKSVVAHEQLIFVIKNAKITEEPWSAQIDCFSIWEQTDAVVTFKLRRSKD